MKLKAPEGMTTFSHNGIEYQVPKSGIVEVPDNVRMDELLAHGLTKAIEVLPEGKDRK